MRREFSAAQTEFTAGIGQKKNNKNVAQIAASIGFKIAN
jgi:erythronate-4-phosphate dehydrogenase